MERDAGRGTEERRRDELVKSDEEEDKVSRESKCSKTVQRSGRGSAYNLVVQEAGGCSLMSVDCGG